MVPNTLRAILREKDSHGLVLRLGIFNRIETLPFTLPGINYDHSKILFFLSPSST